MGYTIEIDDRKAASPRTETPYDNVLKRLTFKASKSMSYVNSLRFKSNFKSLRFKSKSLKFKSKFKFSKNGLESKSGLKYYMSAINEYL
jgi:hypothetical protein